MNIEPLESRIAPATFSVSGADLAIRNSAGADVGESTTVGATRLIKLSAGDSLVFNTDGDHVFEPFDPTDATQHDVKLMQITSGRAIVFLTDFNHDSHYRPTEISGLAVSDKFGAQISPTCMAASPQRSIRRAISN